MPKKLFSSIVFVMLAAAGGVKADQWNTALELLAESVTLPEAESGDVVVQGCSSCPAEEFETTATTSYEINGIAVHLSDLRVQFAAQPKALLLLQLTPDRKRVARVNLHLGAR